VFFSGKRTFVTDEGSYSLSKFEIAEGFMQELKEMHRFQNKVLKQ